MRIVVVLAMCALAGTVASAQEAAQPAKSPYMSVIGSVDKVDSAAKVLTVKPDKGDPTTVKFDDKTAFLRITAGETDMKKAVPGTSAEVAVGDRIVARVFTADPTGKPARTLYITKQAELAKRQEVIAEEWKTATTGLVSSVDTSAHQIKFSAKVPGSPTPKEIVADISGKVDFRRYNPDSGAYEVSSLADIKPGDQVRVIGEKNADMTEIKAERIGSGSFKTIGVQVKTIDAATKTITGIETGSKKPVTIALRADTSLKKFNDMAAMMVARQLNPSYQGMGGGRGRGNTGGGAPPASAPGAGEGARGGASTGGGRGASMGGGRGGRNMDIGRIIEQQPSIELSELKPGDAVIVTGATGNDPSKITATALVAGVEQILRAAPSNGADPLAGSWNMEAGGGGGGGAQ